MGYPQRRVMIADRRPTGGRANLLARRITIRPYPKDLGALPVAGLVSVATGLFATKRLASGVPDRVYRRERTTVDQAAANGYAYLDNFIRTNMLAPAGTPWGYAFSPESVAYARAKLATMQAAATPPQWSPSTATAASPAASVAPLIVAPAAAPVAPGSAPVGGADLVSQVLSLIQGAPRPETLPVATVPGEPEPVTKPTGLAAYKTPLLIGAAVLAGAVILPRIMPSGRR